MEFFVSNLYGGAAKPRNARRMEMRRTG